MHVSEARMLANQANSAHSTGPKSAESKAISRRNGLKHGLSGAGIVTSEADQAKIDRRIEALEAEMKPVSQAGAILIGQMARLSVRAERAAEHETAAIAHDVRHAADAFDERRIEQAEQLFQALADDPRNNLRKLRKSPEGVERLIQAWLDLRNDLSIDPSPEWTAEHLGRAANLIGLMARHARGSRLGALSRGFWGDFSGLGKEDGAGLDDQARQAWALAALFEQIDAEIAALEAHHQTLDFEAIELDRAEAGARALFDSSKAAQLARRYEAEARRGFFKALKEFRLVEAEAAANAPAASTIPKPAVADSRVGSSRENPPPLDRAPARTFPQAPRPTFSPAMDRNGDLARIIPVAQSPG